MADKMRVKSIRDIYPYIMSSDYQNRFIGEYMELCYRIHKLEAMLTKAEDGELDFALNCPITLLESQLISMRGYKKVLEVRAEVEKITFPEVIYG